MSACKEYIERIGCCSYTKYKPDPKDHIDEPGYSVPYKGKEQIGAEQYMGRYLISWRIKNLKDRLHSIDKVGIPLAKFEYEDCMSKQSHNAIQCKITLDASMKRLEYEKSQIKSQLSVMDKQASKSVFQEV